MHHIINRQERSKTTPAVLLMASHCGAFFCLFFERFATSPCDIPFHGYDKENSRNHWRRYGQKYSG